jgi:RNA 3'-terminal phosphate cyclase (ATP)
MSKTIELDGSFGEGGGQILRTSLALSLITGKPFHLRKVRAGRDRPGLQPQHLMSVKAAAEIGQARLRGASLGSSDLVFEPGQVSPGNYRFAIGTAGATSLVLHTVYLPLVLGGEESRITIEGGTHVKASPCAHFLQRTWSAYLRALGVSVEVSVDRLGFYPRGGGCLRVRIAPAAKIQSFQGITTDAISKASVVSMVAGLPRHVAERQMNQAESRLSDLGLEVDARMETGQGGPGCMLGIALPTEPAATFFFGLGEKGKPAERVADEAVDQVVTFLASQPLGVDEHSADQIVLPLALAEGPSQFRVSAVSSHLLTNIAVIRQFLDRTISCEEPEGSSGVVKMD